MSQDERERRTDSGESEKTGNTKRTRLVGDLAAGAVLALELSGKLAGAVLNWLTAKPAAPMTAAEQKQPGENDQPGSSPENTGRADDRNLTLEKEHNLASKMRWGTFFVLFSFAFSFAGGVGFLFIYWTGGSNELLGASLAAFFAGLGAGFVGWAHRMTVHKEAVEPREPHGSSPQHRESAASQWEMGAHEIHRRGLLCWMSAIGLGFMAAFAISLLRSFGFNPYKALYTRVWQAGQRLVTQDGRPIHVNSMPPGSTAVVFPERSTGSEKSQTVLIRVHPSMLELPRDREDWAVDGYVAYSRICTHAGCAVGMYEATAHLLMCPCHQSTFDILRAAQPTGGPAARPLPQLPLYADSEGFLRAAGGFSQNPGPGFWGIQE